MMNEEIKTLQEWIHWLKDLLDYNDYVIKQSKKRLVTVDSMIKELDKCWKKINNSKTEHINYISKTDVANILKNLKKKLRD